MGKLTKTRQLKTLAGNNCDSLDPAANEINCITKCFPHGFSAFFMWTFIQGGRAKCNDECSTGDSDEDIFLSCCAAEIVRVLELE